MQKTILLTNHYQGTPLQILEQVVGDRFRLQMLSAPDYEELKEAVSQADYLLVSGRLPIDQAILQRARKLRMVQRTGVGIDMIDLDCLKRCGIPLYVNRGVNAVSVAEHTVMLMLAALKNSYAVNLQMRQGIWKKQETGLRTRELTGKTVGLIGMGHIGRTVVRMLRGFDVDIRYYDQFRLTKEEEEDLHITYEDFETVLKMSDIVSLHCALNRENAGLIRQETLALMKDGAVLINTARGKLVKQEDLVQALREGKLSACGIDTFEEEPPLKPSDLASFDQALLSPHIGGVSYEAFTRMMEKAVESISMFDQGRSEEIRDNRIV